MDDGGMRMAKTPWLFWHCRDLMYTPIESDDDEPPQLSTREPSSTAKLKTLTTSVVWISSWFFAIFTAGHYIRHALQGEIREWETTDPGLYRPKHSIANGLMLFHFFAGVILMIAGPVQLIPSFRQNFLDIHRLIGRMYIFAALMASLCATIFVLMYGTSRGDHYEDSGNILFGLLVFLCACQSYRHVAFTKKMAFHKLWSWRLYSLVLGALLYRLYATVYFAFLLYTPWQGNDAMYESMYFLFYLPNLVVVEILWRMQQQQPQNAIKVGLFSFCTIFLVTTSLAIFFFSWLPAIQGKSSVQSQVLGAKDGWKCHHDLHLLLLPINTCKFCCWSKLLFGNI